MKIKKNDLVKVITGKDKGKEGKVMDILHKKDLVLVEGVNMVKKHTKPTNTSSGGIISKELPIHISNVKLINQGI